MRLLLCGVRGSTPASGVEFAGVGGATSCVAIPATGGRWLVLDAGTGLTRLGVELADAPLHGTILLTHLHWDHTHGLPFMANADRHDAIVDVHLPAQSNGDTALEVMARAMSPPHFPITPDELAGVWRYHDLDAGSIDVESFRVTAAEVEHGRSRTFGYRIDDGSVSVAYVPDHCPHLASPERLAAAHELAHEVDVLLHGGGYLASERAIADDYRHATIDDSLAMAEACRVGRLVLVHHPPRRTDAEVAAIERELAAADRSFAVTIGREGEWLEVS